MAKIRLKTIANPTAAQSRNTSEHDRGIGAGRLSGGGKITYFSGMASSLGSRSHCQRPEPRLVGISPRESDRSPRPPGPMSRRPRIKGTSWTAVVVGQDAGRGGAPRGMYVGQA
jgi:hypothetical protein